MDTEPIPGADPLAEAKAQVAKYAENITILETANASKDLAISQYRDEIAKLTASSRLLTDELGQSKTVLDGLQRTDLAYQELQKVHDALLLSTSTSLRERIISQYGVTADFVKDKSVSELTLISKALEAARPNGTGLGLASGRALAPAGLRSELEANLAIIEAARNRKSPIGVGNGR